MLEGKGGGTAREDSDRVHEDPHGNGPMIPHLRPLFLSTYGRSGSTILMRVLSLHAQIVIRAVFPYETRAAQYYSVSSQGRQYASFSPIIFNRIEYKPFQGGDGQSIDWSKNHTSTRLGANGEALTQAYYRFVARVEDKLQAEYFAEKITGLALISTMLKDSKAAKVIFLKRDPRDVFLSIKSFNKKRGYLSFGEERGDESMYAGILSHFKRASDLALEIGGAAVQVRYEDLIANQRRTLSKLFASLKLNHNGQYIRRIVDEAFEEDNKVRCHKTTPSGRASIGRWKTEANQQYNSLFQGYHDALHTLGYK